MKGWLFCYEDREHRKVSEVGHCRFEVCFWKRCDGVTDEEYDDDCLGNSVIEYEYFKTRIKARSFLRSLGGGGQIRRQWLERHETNATCEWIDCDQQGGFEDA